MGRVVRLTGRRRFDNPIRFQGQYYDEELGLCYNRHRYFDPHTCSFISQDPLGLVAGTNLYAYAPNVWGWVDPLGLCRNASNRGIVSSIKDLIIGRKPGGNPNILSGHGSYNPRNGTVTVPEGTSVTVWTEHGNSISDKLGNYIETGKDITFQDFGSKITGARTYLPGSQMPNYTLHPPFNPDLNIMGNPTTVWRSVNLSNLIKPGQGNIQWAACLSEL
jgi:RHS repeat-associated protein